MMRNWLSFRIEKRTQVNPLVQVVSLVIALVAAMGVSSVLILSAGANVGEAFSALFSGGFGSWDAFLETLVKSTPMILTGLAATIAFRAQIWNIGAEGQLVTGAMFSFWAAMNLTYLPAPLLFVAILLAAFLGGALCGWIPGYLKARLNTNEIIVTVMMNYIVRYGLSFMLSGPWKDPSSYYLQSSMIPDQSLFPVLVTDSRLHAGFIVAVLIAIFFYILLFKTTFGYEVRALGLNPTAAKFKGIPISRIIIAVMVLSGGVAGLAGAGELVGLQHRLRLDISAGYGFTGIIIAMLANLHPIGVIFAAIFFGGLVNGSLRMQIVTGVPVAIVYVIQAVVLLFLLTAQVISNYQVRRVKPC
jgi:simple sugar transport system permease protein